MNLRFQVVTGQLTDYQPSKAYPPAISRGWRQFCASASCGKKEGEQ